jgi:hypothetical protein
MIFKKQNKNNTNKQTNKQEKKKMCEILHKCLSVVHAHKMLYKLSFFILLQNTIRTKHEKCENRKHLRTCVLQ